MSGLQGLDGQSIFSPEQVALAITPKKQELIILPTEKCNLRCSYCYEDFAIGKMSEVTQLALERFIERRTRDLTALTLNWFGGEPLAAKDVVLRLSRYAHRICEERGVQFHGGTTTNAYLLDRELFDALVACRQDFFQITLDGWAEQHDAVRKFANGKGSFDRIWKNLLAIRESAEAFEIVLRVHVRRENIGHLDFLMERLGEAFADDSRFRLDFEHVRDLGGAGGASVQNPVSITEVRGHEVRWRAIYRSFAPGSAAGQPHVQDFADEEGEALNAAKQMGESAGGRRIEEILTGGGYICYASKPNSLLIRANGRIGKCTVALTDDRNDIGHIKPDGAIQIDNERLRPWIRGLADLDPNALGCPLVSLPRADTRAA